MSQASGTNVEDLGFQRGHRTLHIIGKGNKPATIPLVAHMLRAAFIMAALDAGVPLRDVQIAARHADPERQRSTPAGERTSTDTPPTS